MSPKNSLSGASLALVTILCAPVPGRAADKTFLRPALELEQSWDSNIYGSSRDEDGSAITRISPGIWLENSGELGHARLGLNAVAREVWKESDLSGIDSSIRGDFQRNVTPRLALLGDGALEYFSGYEEIREGGSSDPAGLPGAVILSEQPTWKRDQVGGGFRYVLTPRLALRLQGSAGRINYERIDATATSSGEYRDRSLLGAHAGLQYQVTPLDLLSLSVSGDDTSYQDLGTGTNDSQIWSSELGWLRSWSPVLTTTAAIGVRSIDSTQDDVPQSGGSVFGPLPLPSKSFSDSGTGLVGSFVVERAFERSAIRLSYDRDTRSTGGTGRTNFDIDSFALLLTHRLAARVRLTVAADYSLYHSVTDEIPNYPAQISGFFAFCALGGAPTPVDSEYPFPVYQCVGGSSEESRDYTSLRARIDWQMRRQLNGFVVVRYYRSVTDQTLGSGIEIETQDASKLTLGVGFRYEWDLDL